MSTDSIVIDDVCCRDTSVIRFLLRIMPCMHYCGGYCHRCVRSLLCRMFGCLFEKWDTHAFAFCFVWCCVTVTDRQLAGSWCMRHAAEKWAAGDMRHGSRMGFGGWWWDRPVQLLSILFYVHLPPHMNSLLPLPDTVRKWHTVFFTYPTTLPHHACPLLPPATASLPSAYLPTLVLCIPWVKRQAGGGRRREGEVTLFSVPAISAAPPPNHHYISTHPPRCFWKKITDDLWEEGKWQWRGSENEGKATGMAIIIIAQCQSKRKAGRS